MGYVDNFITFSTELISNGGIIFGMLVIMLESFIPVLPLCVFIGLNINALGFVIGFIVSWISTCIGCYISYLIFYHLSKDVIIKRFSKKKQKQLEKGITSFKKISLSKLVIVLTLPFTPAFLMNIIAGVVGVDKKKFITALIIGKFFMVLFWGYVAKSLIDSMTDIRSIIAIIIILIVAYVISKVVSKKFGLE